MDTKVFGKLLQQAESDLAEIRRQRAELERAERLATEKLTHIRALIDLSGPDATDDRSAAEHVAKLPEGSAQVEDVAAHILGERGPMHYRDLYAECERRGAVIISSNPAAVLLTRISRDPRFRRAEQRGHYRLAEPEEEPPHLGRTRWRRRKRRRQRRPVEVTP